MHIQLYTYPTCRFCEAARDLLVEHGIAFQEQSLAGDRELGTRLRELFGRAAMPYVMLDGEPLGGLQELERAVVEWERDA